MIIAVSPTINRQLIRRVWRRSGGTRFGSFRLDSTSLGADSSRANADGFAPNSASAINRILWSRILKTSTRKFCRAEGP